MSDYAGTLKFDTSIDANSFNSGLGKLGSLASKGLRAVTKVVGAVTAGVTAFGTSSFNAGNDFYAGMSQVEAISGAAGEDLEALTNKALEMGAKTKFSATESAEAFNYMAMAGWKTNDMLDGIEGIMSLAAAAGEDLGTTSDIVTDALTAFGMTAGDSGRLADVLAAASANANTNVSMLGESFKYVAPMAGALGYSAEDTALALGLMANAGIKSSQAGTSLRGLLTRLAKPTKQSQAAIDRLGLSLDDGQGNMLSFRDVMVQIRDGFGDLMVSEEDFYERLDDLNAAYKAGQVTETEYNNGMEELISQTFNAEQAEKARTAAMLAGQNGLSGLLAIVNASEEDFDKLCNAIDNSAGSAEQIAATMQNNLAGDITIAKSALEGLQIAFYNTFGDNLRTLVQQATGYLDQMKTGLQENGFEGFAAAGGQAIASLLESIANAVPQVVTLALQFITSFCNSIDRGAVSLGLAGTNIIVTLIKAIFQGGSQLAATGIHLIAVLLAGIAQRFPEIMRSGGEAVKTLMQALIQNAPVIFRAGLSILKQLTEGIKNNLPQLIPVAMNALMEFSGGLRSSVGELFTAGLELIMALAQALIDNIPVFIETVPTIITNLCGIINDNAPLLLAAGLQLIIQLAMGLIQAIPTLVANIPQIIEAVVSVFMAFNWLNLGSNIIKMIGNGVKALSALIPNLLNSIGSKAVAIIGIMCTGIGTTVSKLPGVINTHLQNILTKTITWGSQMVQRASSAMQSMLSTISNWVSQIPGKVANFLNSALTNLITWGSQMVQRASSAMQSMISSISNWLSQLPGKFSTIFNTVLNTLTTFANNMKTKATEAAKGFVTNITDGLKGLPDQMKTIGSNIVQGIWNGISSGWDWLKSQVSGLASNLLSATKNALGISSPSKAFRDEVGQWIPAGIVEGVHRSMPKAVANMKEEMSGLVTAMQGSVAFETSSFGSAAGAAMAGRLYGGNGMTVYNNNNFSQENTYNVPTATPSEVNKAQREAFRNFAKEVK